MVKAIIVDGVEFPVAYNGYKYSRNKLWSNNAGRTNTGKSVGTIIAIKDKAEVTLTPLTPAKAKIIDDIVSDISKPFREVKVLFVDGTQKTMNAYFGDISYQWLSQAIGENGLITGVKVSIIEQ